MRVMEGHWSQTDTSAFRISSYRWYSKEIPPSTAASPPEARASISRAPQNTAAVIAPVVSLLALLSVCLSLVSFLCVRLSGFLCRVQYEPQNWCVSASPDYLFRRGDAREIADVQREDYTRAIGERSRCYPCRGVAYVMTNEFTVLCEVSDRQI